MPTLAQSKLVVEDLEMESMMHEAPETATEDEPIPGGFGRLEDAPVFERLHHRCHGPFQRPIVAATSRAATRLGEVRARRLAERVAVSRPKSFEKEIERDFETVDEALGIALDSLAA